MKITSEQIKKDVEYLTDLKISKDDINEILNNCEKSDWVPHSIFAKSLCSFLTDKNQKMLQSYMTLTTLTLQYSTLCSFNHESKR